MMKHQFSNGPYNNGFKTMYRKITAVIPCFPYARQPDAPYKKNGTLINRIPHDKAVHYHTLTSGIPSPSPSSADPSAVPASFASFTGRPPKSRSEEALNANGDPMVNGIEKTSDSASAVNGRELDVGAATSAIRDVSLSPSKNASVRSLKGRTESVRCTSLL
jgi:phosphoribosylpyrophosphate synthetase